MTRLDREPGKAPSLKQRVLRAGGWSFGGHGLSQIIRLGSNLALTRLLVPEMFGIMAIASLTMMLLSMLSDVGLNQNVVQSHRGDDRTFLDTVWTVQILRGLLLWLIAIAASLGLHIAQISGWVSDGTAYASPLLPWVISVSSLSAVILGLQSTKRASAQRNLNQRRLVEIDVIGQLVGLAVMIVAAIYTRSIWALVSGGIVSALVVTVLSHVWMSGMPNRLRLEKEALIELFGFGKWIIASSALTVFAAGGDRLLLGGLIAAHDFGLYVIAAVIVRAGEGAVGSLFGVSLSALSEIARSDRSKLVSVYYRLSLPLEILLLFLAGFLFAAGHSVIKVLYDSRYEQAGPILEVLALSLIPIKYGVAQQAYLAVGKPNWLTVVNVVRCASLYGLVPLLYSLSGPQGALWGIAVHGFAVIPVCYIFNARIGLVKVRREVGPFVLLPVGYFAGAAVNYFVG